jgi:hypothetical protein
VLYRNPEAAIHGRTLEEQHVLMKPQLGSAQDLATRRAAARRTALILGGIALLLFVLSFIEVVRHK